MYETATEHRDSGRQIVGESIRQHSRGLDELAARKKALPTIRDPRERRAEEIAIEVAEQRLCESGRVLLGLSEKLGGQYGSSSLRAGA